MKEQGTMTLSGEVTLQRSIAISVPLLLTVQAEYCPVLTTHPGFVDEWEKVLKGTQAAGDFFFSYSYQKLPERLKQRFYAEHVHWFCWAPKINRNELVLKVRLSLFFWFFFLGFWGLRGLGILGGEVGLVCVFAMSLHSHTGLLIFFSKEHIHFRYFSSSPFYYQVPKSHKILISSDWD